MSSLLPDGWNLKNCAELCHVITKGTTPSSVGFSFQENGINFIKVESINSNGVINARKFAFISEETNLALKRSIVCEGDILITIAGATVGKLAVVQKSHLPANTNQALAIVRPNEKKVYGMYLYYWLQTDSISKNIDSIKTVGAQPNLSLAQVGGFLVNSPTLPEQQKIAKILTSVDEVIEKTQTQIDKLKDLKTGMMQELLTNGIGHAEFKDSPVGRIPAEWNVVRVDEIVTKVGSGVTPKGGSKAYVSSGIPLIRSQNVHSDGLRLDNVSFITAEQHQKMKGSQLQSNDVLLNITGASIGRCYYLADDFIEGNVNQHVCIIRLKKHIVSHVFITLLLNGQLGQTQIMSLQAGGNREGLNFQQIREIKLPLPPIEEQVKISNTLSSIERKIRIKESKLNAVIKIKKALMQDLLTGKVRVKVDSE